MVPSPRGLPHTISPLEDAGFEQSVPREAPRIVVVSALVRADFSACGEPSISDMSRHRKLGRVTRDRWFESLFLQQTVRLSAGVARRGRKPGFSRGCAGYGR